MRRLLRRVLPRTLAARTALFLLLALMAVQAAGLTIHAFDRVELQRVAEARETAFRSFSLWRNLVTAPPERRPTILAEADLPSTLMATLDNRPTATDLPPVPPPAS